jgi:hypothetical protein
MAEKSVVIYDGGDFLEHNGYVSPMPKNTPAGYKVVQARYLVEHVSVWIVPDNIDESRLWCKWDALMYSDKDGKKCIDIDFEKVLETENTDSDAYKRPQELKICVAENEELQNEAIFFDCETDKFNKKKLKTARDIISKDAKAEQEEAERCLMEAEDH